MPPHHLNLLVLKFQPHERPWLRNFRTRGTTLRFLDRTLRVKSQLEIMSIPVGAFAKKTAKLLGATFVHAVQNNRVLCIQADSQTLRNACRQLQSYTVQRSPAKAQINRYSCVIVLLLYKETTFSDWQAPW